MISWYNNKINLILNKVNKVIRCKKWLNIHNKYNNRHSIKAKFHPLILDNYNPNNKYIFHNNNNTDPVKIPQIHNYQIK